MKTSLVPNRAARAMESWFGRGPFRDLRAEMDDMLSHFAERRDGACGLTETWNPSLHVSETDSDFQIMMDAPGMKPDGIEVEVTGDTVRIYGEREEEKEEKERTFHRVERHAGSFVLCRAVVRRERGQSGR